MRPRNLLLRRKLASIATTSMYNQLCIIISMVLGELIEMENIRFLWRYVLPASGKIDIGHWTCLTRDSERSGEGSLNATWVVCPPASLDHLEVSMFSHDQHKYL